MEHRVIWKEGTLILPQHFQQQERFFLSELSQHTKANGPFFWGFKHLEINNSDLELGIFSLKTCVGVLPDGTSFNAPQVNKLPSSLKLEDGIVDKHVYLTLPERTHNTCDVNYDGEASSARLKPHTLNLKDNSGNSSAEAPVTLGELDYKLYIAERESDIPAGTVSLAIAKVKEVVGGKIVLCEEFIPHLSNILECDSVKQFLREFAGMLFARGDELAQRVSSSGKTTGVTQYSDFLLLQFINRVEPIVLQYLAFLTLRPVDLYTFLVSCAGELSTFMKLDKRRPIKFPVYEHNNLQLCFSAVIEDIRSSFTVVYETVASQIALSKPKNNIVAARLSHKALLQTGSLILVVASDLPEESMRHDFPAQIKIGPGEKIFSLVQSALPGIRVNLMTHVPSEIPYRTGHIYFELDKNDKLWPELQQSNGLAIHIGGNFPNLGMELWAINRQ